MKEFAFTPQWDGKTPLYEQIYRAVVEDIRQGELREGDKLPSKRALCAHLGVSLSTVEGAYGLLCAEGYIAAYPRSGYRVCPVLPLALPPDAPPPAPPAAPVRPALREDFSTGGVDTSLFPYAAWARLTREAVREPALLQRGHSQGDTDLRYALCAFLHQYRGVVCQSDQIIVGAGMEYLLTLLLQILPPDALIGLEDPGYPSTRRTLENLHRPYLSLPLDGQGLRPDALEHSGAEIVYITPSHQFPLGLTMPAARRSELLRWAYEKPGRYIIEDDYDSEFRYSSRPIPAVQGIDGGNRVIYIGTFSRSIAPSIRCAYLILPRELLGLYRARFAHGASTVSRFEQQVLFRFLSSGQYQRHLRRVSNLYRQRCAALTQALEAAFPDARVSGNDAGLHLLLTLPGRREEDLLRAGERAGYRLHGLSEYCHGSCPQPGTLVLGFAGLDAAAAPAAVADLKAAFG